MASNQGLYSRRWKEILVTPRTKSAPMPANGCRAPIPTTGSSSPGASARSLPGAEQRQHEFRIPLQGRQLNGCGSGILITRNDTGNTLRMVGTLSDIDARNGSRKLHTTLLELEQRRHEAERHAAAKSRFLNAASHDLRQPLYAIQLFADADAEKLPRPGNARCSTICVFPSRAMSAQLECSLDVSRFDMASSNHQLRDIALARLRRSGGPPTARDRARSGVSLRFLPGSGAALHTDAVLIGRLLGNLIDNAIKSVAAGGSVLRLRAPRAGRPHRSARQRPRHRARASRADLRRVLPVGNPARNPERRARHWSRHRPAHRAPARRTADAENGAGRGTVFAVTLATGAGPRETR